MIYKILVSFLLFGLVLISQNKIDINNLKSDFATLNRQEKEFEKAKDLVQSLIESDSIEQLYNGLNASQQYFIKNDLVKNTLRNILSNYSDSGNTPLLTAMEVSKTLYPEEFQDEITKIAENTKDPKTFAFAVNCISNINSAEYLELLHTKFSTENENPLLKCLAYQLMSDDSVKFSLRPPLEDILDHEFQNDKTIIYTFFRSDRHYPGLTVIKKPDGSFVTDENGDIFSIPQFSLSYANIPGYLTNGNTPEGIFSIVGSYISPTESIGPTRNVLTRIAYEVSPEIFFHRENENSYWDIENYRDLLPHSWQEYFPVYEAFYAGQAGRRVIIMHGSADDLRFFKDQSYYPHTPTKGCISSIELWNSENGKCIRSDQAKLINAFYSTGQIEGFLVILELDDKKEHVSLKEIIDYLQ
nr:hypothetical protein [uncultured Sphaerochaeta sp.]